MEEILELRHKLHKLKVAFKVYGIVNCLAPTNNGKSLYLDSYHLALIGVERD